MSQGTCTFPCIGCDSLVSGDTQEVSGVKDSRVLCFPLSCEILKENHCLYFLESYVLLQPGKVEYSRMISNRKGSSLGVGLMLY